MNKLFLFILLVASFLYGFYSAYYKSPPYNLIKDFRESTFPPYQLSQYFDDLINFKTDPFDAQLSKFSQCYLPKLSEVTEGSHLFIGHAYGALGDDDEGFLHHSVHKFLDENSSKLNTLTFTGDVFYIPSIEKWKRLRDAVGDQVKVYIAPGNHDTARQDSQDVFRLSEFGRNSFPILNYLDDTPFIVDDSVNSKWKVAPSTIELANSIQSDTIIIARHNMPTEELLLLANSLQHKTKTLESVQSLSQKFNKNTAYFWIIGDSGAFNYLPRVKCLKYENHTFIVNGLGGFKDDAVIIYNHPLFFSYNLASG